MVKVQKSRGFFLPVTLLLCVAKKNKRAQQTLSQSDKHVALIKASHLYISADVVDPESGGERNQPHTGAKLASRSQRWRLRVTHYANSDRSPAGNAACINIQERVCLCAFLRVCSAPLLCNSHTLISISELFHTITSCFCSGVPPTPPVLAHLYFTHTYHL